MKSGQTSGVLCLVLVAVCMLNGCGNERVATAELDAAQEEAVQMVETTVSEEPEERVGIGPELAESASRGREVYHTFCVACHMPDGKGLSPSFPPLANSDYLMEDPTRAIRQVIYGKEGEMVVNGISYNGIMPAQPLDNEQTADVMNYVMNEWGNEASVLITPEMVKEERE
ncbi:MAG: cytochrome c [Bacteroidota bacterium]